MHAMATPEYTPRSSCSVRDPPADRATACLFARTCARTNGDFSPNKSKRTEGNADVVVVDVDDALHGEDVAEVVQQRADRVRGGAPQRVQRRAVDVAASDEVAAGLVSATLQTEPERGAGVSYIDRQRPPYTYIKTLHACVGWFRAYHGDRSRRRAGGEAEVHARGRRPRCSSRRRGKAHGWEEQGRRRRH